jgi:hypothetical protein
MMRATKRRWTKSEKTRLPSSFQQDGMNLRAKFVGISRRCSSRNLVRGMLIPICGRRLSLKAFKKVFTIHVASLVVDLGKGKIVKE